MNILKLAALLLSSSMALAEVPQLINYQGMLSDAQGNPKPSPANLSFTIYDSASGTNVIWGPQTFTSVPLINGSFNVILGTTDANGAPIANAFQTADSFLQITDMGSDVASTSDDTEISPRQQILSAPYALNSSYAAVANNAISANDVPYLKNAVVAFAATVCPAGWSEFTQAHGRFIRGIDTTGSTAIDPAGRRSPGNIQGHAFARHSHGYQKIIGNDRAGTGSNNFNAPKTQTGEFTPQTSVVGSDETRPVNVALLYCKKN